MSAVTCMVRKVTSDGYTVVSFLDDSLGLSFLRDILARDFLLLLSGFWLPGRAKHVSFPNRE